MATETNFEPFRVNRANHGHFGLWPRLLDNDYASLDSAGPPAVPAWERFLRETEGPEEPPRAAAPTTSCAFSTRALTRAFRRKEG